MILSCEYALCIFILLIQCDLVSSAIKNPTIDFAPSKRYLIKVNVDIGNPPQNVTLLVDTLSIYLWVYNLTSTSKGFNASNSTTYRPMPNFNLSEYSTRYNIQGSCGYDTIRINNDTLITNFSLCVIDNSTEITEMLEDNEDNVVGILGIGHSLGEDKEDIKSFFLLDKLEENNLIDNSSLSIKYQNEFRGKLRFGDEITHLSDIYTAQANLDIKNDRIWAFNSPMITYGFNNSNSTPVLKRNVRMLIDTSTEYVIVDMKVFDSIVDAFFTEDINTTSCNRTNMTKDGETYEVIKCNNDLHYDSIPNLYIYITDIDVLHITPLDLLRSEINGTSDVSLPVYTFLVIGKQNVKEYTIGQSVLRRFSVTLDKTTTSIIKFSSIDFIDHHDFLMLQIILHLTVIGSIVIVFCFIGYSLITYVFKKDSPRAKATFKRFDKKRPTVLSNFSQSTGNNSLLPKSFSGEEKDDDLKLTVSGKAELN